LSGRTPERSPEAQLRGEPARGDVVGQKRCIGQDVARRLVPDQRHRGQRFELRLGIEGDDLLVTHPLHGFLDHLAIHPHPAAGDVALGVAARAGQLRRQAFGQALRFGPAGVGHVGAYDENRKFITSPSLTT
jgi:hypothetical protein